MDHEESFRTLLQQVRAGDARAAEALVRQYEPEIRRTVRIRLTDPRLRRVVDSVDICQSILGQFFARAALGQFDLESPEQLLKLLVTMARNKIRDQASYQQAQRRDQRRLQAGGDILDGVAGSQATPSRIFAGKELLEEVRRRLGAEERYLADQRALGRDWAEIAAEMGGTPEALRKRLARAMDRVTAELEMDEG